MNACIEEIFILIENVILCSTILDADLVYECVLLTLLAESYAYMFCFTNACVVVETSQISCCSIAPYCLQTRGVFTTKYVHQYHYKDHVHTAVFVFDLSFGKVVCHQAAKFCVPWPQRIGHCRSTG